MDDALQNLLHKFAVLENPISYGNKPSRGLEVPDQWDFNMNLFSRRSIRSNFVI